MHDHDVGQDQARAEQPKTSAPPLPPGPPATRVDRWLWAVRITKTRSDAAQACRAGHVRINDKPAKPATPVKAGDRVRARVNGVNRIVEVSHVIEKRVGAPIATRCYVDHTPAVPPEFAVPVARRSRGAGRPTKRERRQIDRLRGFGL
ncbi:RNA-binding S4 domain-containing protein [Thermobifida halotolerans]|uniref:RNA-binding S4 domain-containing protein n=1 Tax=Thermobifida halotolerans TaxID=483545 RepID=A0A399G794_9ACTN|nr:RNA-binding S4 domain-containing protein [Thermobifida halotolerans]UOE20775.1 RNA-binding S4 domain-containing protein [Thermobifida halotolerans]